MMTTTAIDLIDQFLTWLKHNRGRSDSTIAKYRKALLLLAEMQHPRELLETTNDELVLFTGIWLHRRGVGARARRSYVAAVRGFYKWAIAHGRTKSNPAAALNYPSIGRPLPHAITLDNFEKLMWAPDLNTFEGVRDSAMIAILGGCGLRVTGLVRLNVGDVFTEIIVEKDLRKERRLFIRVHEKGDTYRKVPVPREAELQLTVYMEHPALKEIDRSLPNGDQVLFVTTRNRRCPPHEYRGERRRFNRRSVNAMLMAHGEKQKIPSKQLHPHALRHLYGTELAEGDVDILARMRLMGQKDPKSNEIYTDMATRKLVREVDRAGPMGKIRTPASDLLRSMQSASASKTNNTTD